MSDDDDGLSGGQRRLAALLERQDDESQEMVTAYDRDVAPLVGPDDDLPRLYRTTDYRPGRSPLAREVALYVGPTGVHVAGCRIAVFVWCADEALARASPERPKPVGR